ncbi:FkbM family methyltransferase [Phycisphaeraceae bacterium D3-23]
MGHRRERRRVYLCRRIGRAHRHRRLGRGRHLAGEHPAPDCAIRCARRGRCADCPRRGGGRQRGGGVHGRPARPSEQRPRVRGRAIPDGRRPREAVRPDDDAGHLLASFPAPDFVKIDIEGAEVMAIRGGERLLRDIRPVFYIEVGQHVSDEMLSIFREARYAAFDPKGKPLTDTCASNTFFVPDERVAGWQV